MNELFCLFVCFFFSGMLRGKITDNGIKYADKKKTKAIQSRWIIRLR